VAEHPAHRQTPPASLAVRKDPSVWSTVLWWLITFALLIIVDDLTFGPLFWVLARLTSAALAFAVAFGLYLVVQTYLIWQGTSPDPSRAAAWFLSRLRLDRKWDRVAANEQSLQRSVVGAFTAIAAAPIIGGVLPPVLLHKSGASVRFSRQVGFVTALVYAAEFALLHGWIPGSL